MYTILLTEYSEKMELVLRRRKFNSVGLLRGCKKNFAANITVAFFRGDWNSKGGRHD